MNRILLGDICTKESSNIKQSDLEGNDGKYPIYGASGFIKNVDFYAQEKPYVGIVKDGAGVGRVMKLPAYSSVIGTMQYIIPNDDIDVSYLAYAMEHMNLSKYYMGAAIPHIYFKDYKNEKLPNHTQDEQTQIVHVLDLICNQITKRNDQLSKLDELIKSRFVEMFDSLNNYTAFSDLCTIITDGTHQPPKFVEEGIPFLFVSNIVTNSINYEAEKFISEDTYNELYKRTPIEIGDIIMSTVGSYGHPAVVTSNKKFLFQRHIAYLKPKKEIINPLFLHSAILSEKVQEQIERRVKGIAQKTLNLSEIKQLRIPLPELKKQNQFADFVIQVEKQKATVQQSIDKLETLKKSLMQEYFGV